MGILDLFRQWVEQRNGKHRPRRRAGLVTVETLESRLVLSPMLSGTTLQVDGTPTNDAISVTQNAAGVTVVINGTTTTYDSSITINAINVAGLDGDDQIFINQIFNSTALTVDGGTGLNTLFLRSPTIFGWSQARTLGH